MSEVRVEAHGRVRRIVLTRPEEMNAINGALISGIDSQLDSIEEDAGVGAILIAAEGKAFCAGADLREARSLTAKPEEFRAWLLSWQRLFERFGTIEKPVIAAVQGTALAGGLELMLACDLVIASERATFGDAHIRYGLVPGGGGSQRLPDAVGSRTARWLMYTGQLIDAEQALQIGLVQSTLPADGFDDAVLDLVRPIASSSGAALSFMKRMSRPKGVTAAALDLEIDEAVELVSAADAQEGISAFVEKRKPQFPSLPVK